MKDHPTGPVSSVPKRFTLPESSLLHDVAAHSRALDREQTVLTDAIAAYVIRRVTQQSEPIATLAETLTKRNAAPQTDLPTSEVEAPPAPVIDLPPPDTDAPAPLDLPGIDPDITFDKWTYDNLPKDDITEIVAIRGSVTGLAFRDVVAVLLLTYGLPRFAGRVRTEEFTTAHALAATIICQGVSMRHFPALDAYLASRRADVTCETLRRTLKQKIMVLQPPEERTRDAAQRRRVELVHYKDGTSCLTLIGPTLDLTACFARIRAFATAINKNQISAFGLPAGTIIEDERGIDALTFDILTRTVPTVSTRVTTLDSVTRTPIIHDEPFVPNEPGCGSGTRSGDDDAQAVNGHVTRRHCFTAIDEDVEPEVISRNLVLAMPTGAWWLSHQAAVIGTVPFLTAYGKSHLPGHLPDGTPISADLARQLVGHSSTLYRVLTDPATGTPLDAKARAYRIPREVRTSVTAKWMMCTAPGCTREAERAELDHVIPFDHEHPDRGGTTTFDNMHPLCRPHHAQKTARTVSVIMPESGIVEYEFAQGLRTTVHAPDRPIDAEHALQWWDLARQKALPDWSRPVLLPSPAPAEPGDATEAGDESFPRASTVPHRPHPPFDPQWGKLDAAAYLAIATRAASRYFATRTKRTRAGTSVRGLHTNSTGPRRAGSGSMWSGFAGPGPAGIGPSGTKEPIETEAGPVSIEAADCTEATSSSEADTPIPCVHSAPPFTDPTASMDSERAEYFRWNTRRRQPDRLTRDPQVTQTRGLDIVDHDPFIIHCTLGTRDDGSPLFQVAADLRRRRITQTPDDHSTPNDHSTPQRRSDGIDWHESDDDPPPF